MTGRPCLPELPVTGYTGSVSFVLDVGYSVTDYGYGQPKFGPVTGLDRTWEGLLSAVRTPSIPSPHSKSNIRLLCA